MKGLDNFRIITKSGEEYDMSDYFGVLVRSLVISSPQPIIETEKGEGAHGQIRLGKTWGPRLITAQCSWFAADGHDVALLRNELYRKLMTLNEFYIVIDAEPNRSWCVEVASEWSPQKLGTYGEFTLEFISHSPYAESVSETTDTFTTKSFRLWNDGDVAIDPRQHRLKITFRGSSTDLRIQNVTTSDVWTFAGNSDIGRVIYLDGVRAMRNTTNIFRDTNRKLITLAPGFNDFIIGGTSGAFTLEFKYRSLYI
jgi:phage-related protein